MENEPQEIQKEFFDLDQNWQDEWWGMPEFIAENKNPFRTIYIHFKNEEAIKLFAELLDQEITENTKYLYFPKPQRPPRRRYVDEF